MVENKKTYQKPEVSVIRLENVDVICTSGKSLNPYGGEEWPDE